MPAPASSAKSVLLHAGLDDRRAGVDLHAAHAKAGKTALRGDGHGLDADDVARAARCMNFAGRDHRRDPAVQAGIDPAELVLARGPVAGHGMNVAVDEARRQRHAIAIDRRGRPGNIEVSRATDGADATVDRHDGVCIKDRSCEVAAEHQANVLNDQLARDRRAAASS